MRSLRKRFSGRLQVMTAAHGEKRFLDLKNPKLTYPRNWPATRPELTEKHGAIVRNWLRRLTPWVEKSTEGFSYAGHDPDVEQYRDVERMRMFFDPDDFEMILHVAELPKLQDCMTFPLSGEDGGSGGEEPDQRSAILLTDWQKSMRFTMTWKWKLNWVGLGQSTPSSYLQMKRNAARSVQLRAASRSRCPRALKPFML